MYQAAGIPIGGIGVEVQAADFDLTLMEASNEQPLCYHVI